MHVPTYIQVYFLYSKKNGTKLVLVLALSPFAALNLPQKIHSMTMVSLRLCISPTEELEFWELTENGGSQWKVEDMPGDCGHDFCDEGVTKYFATSFE